MMVTDGKMRNTSDLVADNYAFRTVTDLKYLETCLNDKNNMHNETKLRMLASHQEYFTLEKLFNTKLLHMR